MKAKKIFWILIFLWNTPVAIFCQRNSVIFTPSPNALQSRVISPSYLSLPKHSLPIYRVEFIDNRYDVSRLGYEPEYKRAPGEIKLSSSLPDVVKKIFTDGIELDNTQNRKMLVIIQQCWITYHANSRYSLLKKNLQAELLYKFECFSVLDTNFYPVKRISGNITLPFEEDVTVKYLVDSFVHTLQTEISKLNIEGKETAASHISETRMNNYIVDKKSGIPNRIHYGVYASFEDFLNQKAITDSIDLIPYTDYYGRNVVAAHLGLVKNGLVEPCSKYWGYFDGRFLFYNTGNGFFIRMFPVNNQFVFADLQQVALNSKKKSITSEAMIGKSTYDIIKDYGKTYHLFFQLNYEDGKLY